MAIPQRQLSLDEFLRLPEHKPALEYLDGVVTQKVSPKTSHSGCQAEVVERFNRHLRPSKLGFAFPELRMTFGGRSLVPDVAVFRWERIPRGPSGAVLEDVLAPPDVVVEIATPGQTLVALNRRCAWYVANGVRVVLLVRPRTCSVTVFRQNVEPVIAREEVRVDLGDVFPGLSFTVRELFEALDLS